MVEAKATKFCPRGVLEVEASPRGSPGIRRHVEKNFKWPYLRNRSTDPLHFYPRDAMLARVIEIATCLSVCLSVCPSRAGIVSKRRKLAS